MSRTKNPKFMYDIYATKIFRDENNREYVISVISAALNIDKDKIRKNLIPVNTKVRNKIFQKDGEVDAVFENDDSIINVEINMNNSNNVRAKNTSYLCHLYLKGLGIKKKYLPKKIIQINLNYFDYYKRGKFIYRSVMMEEELKIKRNDDMLIIDVNLAKLHEMDYNDIRKEKKGSLKWLLYVLANDDLEELKKLYEGDEMMSKVRNRIEYLSEDEDAVLFYDPKELLRQSLIEISEKRIEKRGIKKGINQTKIEIAKNLLHKDMTIQEISEITGLSTREIEKLK